jgi:hypothetical protein
MERIVKERLSVMEKNIEEEEIMTNSHGTRILKKGL